jgi:hypothetical protein
MRFTGGYKKNPTPKRERDSVIERVYVNVDVKVLTAGNRGLNAVDMDSKKDFQ